MNDARPALTDRVVLPTRLRLASTSTRRRDPARAIASEPLTAWPRWVRESVSRLAAGASVVVRSPAGVAVGCGEAVAAAAGGVAVAVAVEVAVGFAVAVGLAVAVGDTLGVGVGVAPTGSARTAPVMPGWAPQTNSYVPSASKVHVPLQPSPVGAAGSGGTGPEPPVVSVHDEGCSFVNCTLWKLDPVG